MAKQSIDNNISFDYMCIGNTEISYFDSQEFWCIKEIHQVNYEDIDHRQGSTVRLSDYSDLEILFFDIEYV